MKVFLKFVILGAWLLFLAALWQNGQVSATNTAARSLPSLGMLSISRKMTEARQTTRSVAWPNPALLLVIPVTGR